MFSIISLKNPYSKPVFQVYQQIIIKNIDYFSGLAILNLMDLIQVLKNLGLNEKEAKVYISLLQIKRATAYSVAKHSGLKKPTTYVILDNLVNKGFANKIPGTKIVQYTAGSPENIFSVMESKLKEAKEILPELKALSRGKEHKVRVSYYEGIDGIKEMYGKVLKIMNNKEVVGFYSSAKNAPQNLLNYWDEWNKERLKRKIRSRGITPKDLSTKKWVENPQKYLLTLFVLPLEKYSSDVSIEVYDDLTYIISSKYLQGIVIDNPDVAKAIRQIFEMVWEKEKIHSA